MIDKKTGRGALIVLRSSSIIVLCVLLLLNDSNGFTAKLSPHWNEMSHGRSLTSMRRGGSTKRKSVRRDYSKQTDNDSIISSSNDSEENSEEGSNVECDNSNLSIDSNQNDVSDINFPNAQSTLQAIETFYQNKDNRSIAESVPTSNTWTMMRPSNLPGVVLLHCLGIYRAAQGTMSFWRALLRPTSMLTLFCILTVASSSMMVNDYYDVRTGVDRLKAKPTFVPSSIKRTLSKMYAVLLVAVAFLPGTVTRLSVLTGAMLTFWYTQHLKPRTWLKNVACAAVMAMAPLTSAAAISTDSLFSTVGRLVSTLLFGFIGRELWMDIRDVESDTTSGIVTVPVKYGKRMASRTAALSMIFMSTLSLLTKRKVSFAMAAIGSSWILFRAWQVVQSEGLDSQALHRAVEESKLALFFMLGSFL
jgi:4-hydroxybenzoate polyprenyltransferase